MALDFRADPWAEMDHLAGRGVDGIFTDCPSTAAAWRDARLAEAAAAAPAASRDASSRERPESGADRTADAGGRASWGVGRVVAVLGAAALTAAAAGLGWTVGREHAARQGYRTLQQRYSMGAASAAAVEQGRSEPVLLRRLGDRLGWGSGGGPERTHELVPQEGWLDRPGRVVLQPMPSDVAAHTGST